MARNPCHGSFAVNGSGVRVMPRSYQQPFYWHSSYWRAVLPGLFLAVILTILSATSSLSESGTLQKFFGSYTGKSISLADQGLSERDLAVTIKPYQNDGFSLDWTTITKRQGGKTKHQSY